MMQQSTINLININLKCDNVYLQYRLVNLSQLCRLK